MMELNPLLQNLAARRPIFHSEADFQHALAWELHNKVPGSDVRLEFRPFPEERFYLDIWLRGAGESVAIELKYLTRSLDVEVNDERFLLKNQAAQDISRHDVIKDVVRVERITREVPGTTGYVVVLTNDASYWKQSLRADTVDAQFRLHEGRVLEGTLAWSGLAGTGTTMKRTDPLALHGRYSISWQQYSRLGGGSGRDFRYLLVEVGSATQGGPFTQ